MKEGLLPLSAQLLSPTGSCYGTFNISLNVCDWMIHYTCMVLDTFCCLR